MRLTKNVFLYYILLVLSLIVIYVLYPSYHPFGGLKFNTKTENIRKKAMKLVDELGLQTNNLELNVDLNQNRGLVIQLQKQYGLEESNKLLREQIPGFYFEAYFKKSSPTVIIRGLDQEKESSEIFDERIPVSDDIKIEFDMNGNLLRLDYEIPDSVFTGLISSEMAKETVLNFLKKYTAFEIFKEDSARFRKLEKRNQVTLNFESSSSVQLETNDNNLSDEQMDYQFLWGSKHPALDNDIKIKTNVTGSAINSMQIDYGIPDEYLESKTMIIEGIWLGISFIFFIIAILILAVRRIRAFEISFKMAIWLAIIVAISNAIEVLSVLTGTIGWDILIPLLIAPTLVGGGFLVLWAISESLGREIWNGKYYSLDLIQNAHFRQSNIGMGLLRGISIGGIIFGLFLILSAVLNRYFEMAVTFNNNQSFQRFNAFLPALNEITRNFYHTAYMITPYVIFVLPLLKKKIYSGPLLIAIGGIILSMSLNERIEPFHFGFFVYTLISIIIVWVFYKHDILSAFFVLFTFFTFDFGIAFFFVGDLALVTSGWFLMAGLMLTLVYASWSIFSSNKVIDADILKPDFVEHITERQRLQRELEIARNVQMDFLPSNLPQVNGLDLAAQCTPALEVGGDYYDFIPLGDKRLGIVIGDVSGKGTQAAFYMTLTKGFINALARSGDNPAQVLKEANCLFYENARRNTFISMVYAIFDIKAKRVTLARAGHNPVIMHTSEKGVAKAILSEGLALGLNKGDQFDKLIENKEISFEDGDVFAFYTDGLTEARNKNDEEYGEDRLLKLIREIADKSSTEILKEIFIDTRKFSRRTNQHDDMSLVVIKISLPK